MHKYANKRIIKTTKKVHETGEGKTMTKQKKVTVFYTEYNSRLQMKKNRQRTIWVSAEMADTWDWSGIEKSFLGTRRGDCFSDSILKVNKIKIGRAILQG